MFRFSLLIAAAMFLAFAPRTLAWSNKEHIQLTRLAAKGLIDDPQTPPEMKAWLKKACPQLLTPDEEKDFFLNQRIGLFPRNVDGIPYWAIVPDMIALTSGSGETERKVEPFGVPERMLHFTDLEYFMKAEERRRYRHDLSNKPPADDIPLSLKKPGSDDKYDTWAKAGMLSLRIQQSYAQLVSNIRGKRLVDQPGQFPRDEHAARWAGYLAHYIEDNMQPQHATEDYKSKTYFADKRGSPNIHWDFEGRLMDDEEADYPELRKEFWEVFSKKLAEAKDPIDTADIQRGSVQVSLISYDALPMIGTAAQKAYGQAVKEGEPEGKIGKFDAGKFFHFKGKYLGKEMTLMEMKAHQMAWSVKRVQRLWLAAWDEAQKPVEQP